MDPACARLSLPSKGGARMVTLSLARDLPRCMLRCIAGRLLGWGVSVRSWGVETEGQLCLQPRGGSAQICRAHCWLQGQGGEAGP